MDKYVLKIINEYLDSNNDMYSHCRGHTKQSHSYHHEFVKNNNSRQCINNSK